MIIHYNCTIGSILLDSFLLIYHPYPPSFHEMIFILVYTIHCMHITFTSPNSFPVAVSTYALYTNPNSPVCSRACVIHTMF